MHVPNAQRKHELEPNTGCTKLSGQASHAEDEFAPVCGLAVPDGHSEHAEAPSVSEYVPALHDTQALTSVLPVLGLRVPARQFVQFAEPSGANEPAWHCTQAASASCPARGFAEPAGHRAHAASPLTAV